MSIILIYLLRTNFFFYFINQTFRIYICICKQGLAIWLFPRFAAFDRLIEKLHRESLQENVLTQAQCAERAHEGGVADDNVFHRRLRLDDLFGHRVGPLGELVLRSAHVRLLLGWMLVYQTHVIDHLHYIMTAMIWSAIDNLQYLPPVTVLFVLQMQRQRLQEITEEQLIVLPHEQHVAVTAIADVGVDLVHLERLLRPVLMSAVFDESAWSSDHSPGIISLLIDNHMDARGDVLLKEGENAAAVGEFHQGGSRFDEIKLFLFINLIIFTLIF